MFKSSHFSQDFDGIIDVITDKWKTTVLEEDKLQDFIEIDTLLERLKKQENMTKEEKEIENQLFYNKDIKITENCKLCLDQKAVAEIVGCQHKFCNGCIGMFIETKKCQFCEKPFQKVKNLKTNEIVELK